MLVASMSSIMLVSVISTVSRSPRPTGQHARVRRSGHSGSRMVGSGVDREAQIAVFDEADESQLEHALVEQTHEAGLFGDRQDRARRHHRAVGEPHAQQGFVEGGAAVGRRGRSAGKASSTRLFVERRDDVVGDLQRAQARVLARERRAIGDEARADALTRDVERFLGVLEQRLGGCVHRAARRRRRRESSWGWRPPTFRKARRRPLRSAASRRPWLARRRNPAGPAQICCRRAARRGRRREDWRTVALPARR